LWAKNLDERERERKNITQEARTEARQ